jgi:hypothetical protein
MDMKTLLWTVCLLATAACSGSDELDQSGEALSKRTVKRITTISYAPNSFVIGNAYPGWTDDVQGNAQFSKGAGNENGANYRWGYLFGPSFDRCAWINDADMQGNAYQNGSKCGSPQEIDDNYFYSTFTDGTHNGLLSDGSDTHMHYAGSGCTDHNAYGNVAPWRVPATPSNVVGNIPDGKFLKWRYVSRDGHWVLVRDPVPPPNEPNWYFVQRGCVSLAPPPPPPPPCGILESGSELHANQEVVSCDGRFRFIMQGDGNLVFYEGGTALWDTHTEGRGGVRVAMQPDGNLVVYDAANHAVWADMASYGQAGAHLAVQNDGNVVIYLGSHALWATNTCCR